ncbi:MAG: ral stress protein [Rhizobium sp.]|nr:ral stress protein [Rhizobium sp.]
MSNIERARTDPTAQLWDEIDGVHMVMLGSPDHSKHMQPMAPQSAREEKRIWFYTKVNTDIAKAAQNGGHVHMCLVTDDYQACLDGDLRTIHSREHIERYWSSMVEAWFPDGKDDPQLTMMCLTPQTAAIWVSTGSKLVFGWEIAKAITTGEEPDVGYATHVSF